MSSVSEIIRGHRSAGGGLLGGVILAAAQLWTAAPATAGSFTVNPVNLTVPPSSSTISLTLKNLGSGPVAVHAVAYRWSQEDGSDHYAPTSDIILSPPIFSTDANATQLIRLGLRHRIPGAAYRVILEEIPDRSKPAAGIRMALKLNLPLYILSTRHGAADVRWSAWRDEAGSLVVEGRNGGTLYSRILSIDALADGGKWLGSTNEKGVILGGGARRWTLGKIAGAPAKLVVHGPQGETRSDVLVERH